MTRALLLGLTLASFVGAQALAQEPAGREKVQADISTREISIQSNFTGIEILIFGSVDFSEASQPQVGNYEVIIVIRGPNEPLIVRKKERVAGIWVNGHGKLFPRVPEFYAALSSRPFRAIAPDETLRALGIGLNSLDFGRNPKVDPDEQAYRSALIRLKRQQRLFQEHDDGVAFIGSSLFRATVALPVNVPIGRYFADIYLFSDGELLSKSQSTLEVNKVGFERWLHMLAFSYPFLYGLLAVTIAVLAGLAGWYTFRRE